MLLRSHLSIIAFVVPVLFVVACGDDDDTGPDSFCFTGTVVSDGGCIVADAGPGPSEGSGGDKAPPELSCGKGTIEKDGKCVPVPGEDAGTPPPPPETPVLGAIGAACKTDKNCIKGTRCLTGDSLPGNFCTVIGCDMDSPCPVGSTCYQATATSAICMPYCDSGSDCREGYNCQPLYTNAINICAPSCELSGACPSGTNCNKDNGLCEIAGCDPKAKKNKCKDDQTCWPDTQGLSSKGGLCLHLCDPKDPSAECRPEAHEVCQPLESDPEDAGFCAPPVCSKTGECPAGATCEDSVCQPPALCDEDDECSDDDFTCVAGKCMPKCSSSEDPCGDIHPGLACADVLEEPACLPIGTFPGGACRPNRDDACSDLAVGDGSTPMVCHDDVCLPDCGVGGDVLCSAISDTLACAVGVFDDELCLPKGTFPGGPCGANNSCAQNLEGNEFVDMQCVSGVCAIGCDERDQWPGYGDALCQVVDPSLTCAGAAGDICVRACATGACGDNYSCFDVGTVPDHENACLPTGSFPGSPCRDTVDDECDALSTGESMKCANEVCVVDCDSDGNAAADDAVCTGVDASLTCAESAKGICVVKCVLGQCLPGYSCLNAGTEDACLPTGSFPGSPCRDTVGDECSPLAPGVNQTCIDDTCVVVCATDDPAAADDALCAGVNAALTCSESIGDLCVVKCDEDGECSEGFSCLGEGTEDACLPTGSFPGSPCRTGDVCDPTLPTGEPLTCAQGTCVVDCSDGVDAAADDAICAGVNAALTCSETADDVCVFACGTNGLCPSGYSCFKPGTENACLPNGTFPGSTCRATGTACDNVAPGVTQTCTASNTCAVNCTTGGSAAQNDTFCAGVGTLLGSPVALTCSETASNVCVIGCPTGVCPANNSCQSVGGENACLPNGSFPGSTCAATGTACNPIAPGVNQTCVMATNTCAIDCNTLGTPAQDDGFCAGVNSVLTCSETGGNVCVIACPTGVCPSNYSCQSVGGENACLPNGTFPGSTCRATGVACSPLAQGVNQTCVTASNTCAIDCHSDDRTPAQDDGFCTAVGNSLGSPVPLTCSETAGDVCVPLCQSGVCPPGFACFGSGTENACFPN